MEHIQNQPVGTSSAWHATGALTAPETSTETFKAGSAGCDLAIKAGPKVDDRSIKAGPKVDDLAIRADTAGQAVPGRVGTLRSDKLARIFMRSKSMDLGAETRSLISDCKTDWLSKTLTAHNAVVPKLAETLLAAAQGDMTEAFAFAAAMGDSCVAAAFFEAGADTVQAAKGFIDQGEWDAVKLIIKDRLFRFSEGSGGISGVMAYALESKNVPSMDWLKWLCDDVPSAGDHVAAHLGQKRDLAGLMQMAASQSIGAGPLIEAVVNMPGLNRDERIGAIRKIVDLEEAPDYGARASEKALYEQLVHGNLEAAQLMIAGGVRWNYTLFIAGFGDDVSTIKNLLKCDGIRLGAVMNTLLSRTSPAGRSAIAYSMINHYALEGHSSSALKIRELKGLLNAREEIKGLFRGVAETMLRNEIQAGNTHAVVILMAAGVTLDDINDLDGFADPVHAAGAQQRGDASSDSGNVAKPRKQFV